MSVPAAILLGVVFGTAFVFLIQAFVQREGEPAADVSLLRPDDYSNPKKRFTIDLRRLSATVLVGLVAGVVSSWPVFAIAAGLAAYGAPALFVGDGFKDHVGRTDAIATWIESLRDSMGQARTVEGALRETALAAPIAIAGELGVFVDEVDHGVLMTDALVNLSDRLDHSVSDTALAALLMALNEGAAGVQSVLNQVASTCRRMAADSNEVYASRASSRTTVKMIIGIVLVVPRLSDTVRDCAGAADLVACVGLVWWLRRMDCVAGQASASCPPDPTRPAGGRIMIVEWLTAGALFGFGLWLLTRSFVAPSSVSLAHGLAGLHTDRGFQTGNVEPKMLDRATNAVAENRRVARFLAPLRSDIGVAGMTEASFLSDVVARAGFLGAATVLGLLALNIVGISISVVWVVLFTLGAATAGGVAAFIDLRETAKRRRGEFLEAMVAFISFVRIGMQFRPLEGSTAAGVRVGSSWPFEMLAEAIADSNRWGEPIWVGLARLGRQYDVRDLTELANTMALGQADGVSLTETLEARSVALQQRLQTRDLGEANKATEKLTLPIVLSAVGFFVFLGYPAVAGLAGS